MKKRRMFDLDMPEEPAAAVAAETFPAGKMEAEPAKAAPETRARRGPMAMAVKENAEALRARAEAEAAIRAENDALATELVRLRRLGLVVELIPIDAVETRKLVRDRRPGDDLELAELKTSIREIGLSNPIRVEAVGQGRFELIQGLRRLTAYRELLAETGDERYARIPAGLMPEGEELEALYRRMVDENLVRKDLSFAEMANLARDYARDPETTCDDPDKAVALLFKSAGYQKRSYIRAFVAVLEAIGEDLRHAREIPRSLGLALRGKLETEPELAEDLRAEFQAAEGRDAEAELAILRRFAGEGKGTFPAGKVEAPPRPHRVRRARVTFDVPRRAGRAKCTAANGRLEIRLAIDFSTIDRRKIEEAVRRLLDQIE